MERHEIVITVFGELPKSCEECIFSSYGQKFCRISNRDSPNFRFRDDRCIYCRELPEGHGRLIDAVALKGSIEGRILAGQGVNVFSEIDNAPTILGAS